MGAEHLGQLEMAALAEEMQVEIAEQRAEGIGILGLLHGARPGRCAAGTARDRPTVPVEHAVGLPSRSSVPMHGAGRSRRSTSTACAPGQEGADDAARPRCRAGRAP